MKTEKVSRKTWFTTKLFLIVFVTLSSSVFLFGQQEDADKSQSPYFIVKSENPDVDRLPLLSTSAKVNIAGVIADVKISQVYKNDGQNPLEAIYVFPASSFAAVYSMEMKIGDRTIVAKIEEKEKARKDYEKAIEKGKRASLLEQLRPNVFQMNVGNIQPGDIISVSLKYTELLVPEDGTYSFVYPTVTGPRFMYKDKKSGNSSNYNQPPYQGEGELPLYDFDIDVNLSAGLPIQSVICTTHHVETRFNGTSKAHISIDDTEVQGGNRDFILSYQLAGKEIQSGLMLYEHGDENFFLMMVQPPKRVVPDNIPPREYIFIVDVSGSMHGFPIQTSKTLMRNLVVNLKPTDRFNVLLFAGTSGWLNEKSVLATEENIKNAIFFIDRQQGGGSTMLLPALKKALDFPRQDKSLSRSFVIVTDGYVSVEKEAFDLIRNHANEANTFAFGIGSSVNRFIIEGLAHVGMGEPAIITKPSEAAEIADKFRDYISNPVLTQITTGYGSFDVYDVEPVSVPDVLAQRPVIIYGKYKGAPKGKITVRGYSGDGPYEVVMNVDEVTPDEDNSALRYLWARKRIQLLDDYRQLRYGQKDDNEILELGLKYNLMTAYTSFIAIDTEKVKDSNGKLITVEQPLPLPKGVSNYAVGYEMEISGIKLNKITQECIGEIEDVEFDMLDDVSIEKPISKDQIKKQMEEDIIKQLKRVKRSCKISSEITLKIYLSANGKVSKVEISGYISESDKECAINKIYRWNFGEYNLNEETMFKVEL